MNPAWITAGCALVGVVTVFVGYIVKLYGRMAAMERQQEAHEEDLLELKGHVSHIEDYLMQRGKASALQSRLLRHPPEAADDQAE
jgi:hypothetical protein